MNAEENKNRKKKPNKNLGDIIKERKLTKKEFLLVISQFKDIEYKELVFKKDRETFYMCALCNERNFKEDMSTKKPFDEEKFTIKILSSFKYIMENDILPAFADKFGKKLKEEIMNEINPRLDKIEADIAMLKSFHIKDIEEYNKNMTKN